MEVNFGRSAPFSLGVEEELQLLSSESYELVSRFDEVAEAAGAHERIKAELLQSTVEVATRISRTVAEAMEDAADMRRRLRDAAAENDTLIASAGTHPFSRYEHQEVTDAPRSTRSSNSSHEAKAGGRPLRGNQSKIFVRADASPVSRPCQKGEFADSASSSGSQVRSAFATEIACVVLSSPTWTCSPKITSRSAIQRIFSIRPV